MTRSAEFTSKERDAETGLDYFGAKRGRATLPAGTFIICKVKGKRRFPCAADFQIRQIGVMAHTVCASSSSVGHTTYSTFLWTSMTAIFPYTAYMLSPPRARTHVEKKALSRAMSPSGTDLSASHEHP